MKALIIKSGSIGDVLLSTPIVRVLKTELDAEVHILTKKNCFIVFEGNPYLDHIHDLRSPILKIRNLLKSDHFDIIVDLDNNLRSLFVRFGNGKKVFTFNKNYFNNWLYVKTQINLVPKRHVVDQYFDILEPLEVKEDHLGLDFYIPDKDQVESDWLPKTHQNGYAAVAISAEYKTRKLPVNRLIELCDRINKPIVLVGNEENKKEAEEIEAFFKQGTVEEEEAIEGLNKKAIIFNACGKFNFNQQASLIKNASWVFTYDNDLMHVASAFKKKTHGIWGSTTPHFGKYPYKTQFTVFENNKIGCRPCSRGGFSNCPKGHFKCMNDVTFDFYLPD